MSPSELADVWQQLDEYLNKGWVHLSMSPYGAPIIFMHKKDWGLYVHRLPGIKHINEIELLSITSDWQFTQQTHLCTLSEQYRLGKWVSLGLDSTR